ncbi:MAG: PEP-CTERM sorting domain-containing protein [Burkholderiaceae bacterium]|nr:PEP-CTERM sorting domain-containing protein [Burkholderiaceae bacterium]MDH3461352.1 PEP-CTERM sorting domain-containing protein [Burkholderiaceae bacterium]
MPEPETYALMLAGLCEFRFVARRRKVEQLLSVLAWCLQGPQARGPFPFQLVSRSSA